MTKKLNSGRNLEWYSTEDLIDCLPQNRPLYKDSNSWQVRTDDMEDTFHYILEDGSKLYVRQKSHESLRAFILRYLGLIEKYEGDAIDDVWVDLSCKNPI